MQYMPHPFQPPRPNSFYRVKRFRCRRCILLLRSPRYYTCICAIYLPYHLVAQEPCFRSVFYLGYCIYMFCKALSSDFDGVVCLPIGAGAISVRISFSLSQCAFSRLLFLHLLLLSCFIDRSQVLNPFPVVHG